MHKKYKLSIIIPTHYTELRHYASIINALSAAEMYPDDIQVVISDNSNCKTKTHILETLALRLNNSTIVRAPLHGNYPHSLANVRSEFCMFIGDDDILFPEGFNDIFNLLDGEKHDAIIGKMGMKTRNNYDFFDYSLLDSKKLTDKVNGYINGIKNGNLLFHSIVRTKVMKEAVRLWFSIPNLQHYHDHIQTLFITINCKWKIHDQSYIIYNMGNWKIIEKRVETEAKYAKSSNLPISITLLQRLFLAVEGYKLIISYKGVNEKEAAYLWFTAWYNRWINALNSNCYSTPEIINCPHHNDALKIINMYSTQKPINVNVVFSSIVEYFNKINGTGSQYKNFWSDRFNTLT